MKNAFKLLTLTFLTVLTFGLQSCSKVPAGNVGIEFHLLGGEKGVDYDVLKPGRYWIGVNEELFLFPTYNQSKIWTSDKREGSRTDDDFNFQSKKGLKLSASVSVEYHVKAEDVPEIFETYKKGLEEVTNKVLRNSLRNAFNIASSTRMAEEIYGEGKVEFMAAVDSIAKIEAVQRGITIDDIFLIGNIVVPTSITKALNAKIEATQLAQQKENELRSTEADKQKLLLKAEGQAGSILKVATAQAQANRLINASLTKTLVDYKKIEKWDGKLPQVSGANALVNLKNQ